MDYDAKLKNVEMEFNTVTAEREALIKQGQVLQAKIADLATKSALLQGKYQQLAELKAENQAAEPTVTPETPVEASK